MPYVNVKVTNENLTPERKARLIAGITALLRDVLDKNPATTHVVIDETPLENWGVGGLPVLEWRARNEAEKAAFSGGEKQ